MNTNETRGPILGKVLMTVFFVILCILFLIPLYALVLGTFKGGAELFVSGLNLNLNFSQLHTKAWRYLFTGIMSNGEYNPHDYFLWYRNSLMVVLVQGSLTLLLSSMVAYGLAKYEFKGKNVIFMCVLMVMMVPLEILMLPMYTQVNAMGMRNTYAGVMLPFLVSMSAVFFFRQFLTGIPYEMIEAARVDAGLRLHGGADRHGRVERAAVADAGALRHEEVHHPDRPEYPLVALRQQLRPDDHRFLLRHPAVAADLSVRAEVHRRRHDRRRGEGVRV